MNQRRTSVIVGAGLARPGSRIGVPGTPLVGSDPHTCAAPDPRGYR